MESFRFFPSVSIVETGAGLLFPEPYYTPTSRSWNPAGNSPLNALIFYSIPVILPIRLSLIFGAIWFEEQDEFAFSLMKTISASLLNSTIFVFV
ncbi:MAG: hypothetical protein AB1656_14775 [Candidatus Omnitrophota bacterium]